MSEFVVRKSTMALPWVMNYRAGNWLNKGAARARKIFLEFEFSGPHLADEYKQRFRHRVSPLATRFDLPESLGSLSGKPELGCGLTGVQCLCVLQADFASSFAASW